MPESSVAKERIDDIEAEMKRLGMWRSEPLPLEAYDFQEAFAMDKMTFTSWLQFVFIPRVRQIIETNGPFPTQSQVGAQAVREFDGNDDANRLVTLLSDFDALIESG
jgi:uncharacterized protein YqcC (DUF446 family)